MWTKTVLVIALASLITPPIAHAQSADDIKGFVIDESGNMGIGTSDPDHLLHIAGDSFTEGVIKGGGMDGQFGTAAVIIGQDTRYAQRPFVLVYDGTGNAADDIQIHAINPIDPTQSVFKTFIIDHPADPTRHLVHASLEGPEGGVYYRGSGVLKDGKAYIQLPDYFEALTQDGDRTIQLTNVDGFDRLAIETQEGQRVANGGFYVMSENPTSAQRFDWEVKAVRADGPRLDVEPLKGSIHVAGIGPYTYEMKQGFKPRLASQISNK